MQTFGLAAFRAAIQRNLELAEYAETLIRSHAELTLMAPATLGIVCFRREWPAATRLKPNAAARPSPKTWNAAAPRWSPPPGWPAATPSGCASSTRPAPRSTYAGSSGTSPAHPLLRPGRAAAELTPIPGPTSWRTPITTRCAPFPPSRVPDSIIQAVHARAALLEVTAGDDVTRRWDSDRFFYIVLSGRYDVFIDSRLIRTMGPGDHFGELAARDWGGDTATPASPPSGAPNPAWLLKSTSEDLQRLIDTEPTIKAKIAATLAERLPSNADWLKDHGRPQHVTSPGSIITIRRAEHCHHADREG